MASTSAAESPVTDATICPVCCGTLKTPKILLCGHSFCLEPCLKTLLEASSSSCPLCRHSIIPPSTDAGADAFPTNYALQSMIATRRRRRLEPPVGINYEKCQVHGEKVEVVCETCMELLCGTCIRLPHDEDHVTKTITEVAAENVSALVNVEEELIRFGNLLKETDKSIEETSTECRAEARRLQTDIDEGAAAVRTLLQDTVGSLHGKVKATLTLIEKRAKEFSMRSTDLKHVTDYAKSIKDSFMTGTGKSEIQRMVGLRELSKTSRKIREDIAALRARLVADERELTMPSDIMPAAWFDNARREVERIGKRKQASVSMIRAFPPQYGMQLGFVMYSLDEIYLVSHSSGRLSFSKVNPKLNVSRENVDIRGGNMMPISPLLGRKNAILFNNSEVVELARHNTLRWEVSEANLSHLADPLFRIRAVSWDEFRTNCYALLNDNITIVHLEFGKTLEDRGSVKLSEPIYVKISNEFHISASGKMAICDKANKNVRYFASVQSQATKSICSPPELAGGVPGCIISRDSDNKWFVFWEGTPESEVGGIYQYSDSFEIEQFVLNVSNVMSFNFLNERFLAIHKPHTTRKRYYDLQMFILQ